jgi:hypothetical protein
MIAMLQRELVDRRIAIWRDGFAVLPLPWDRDRAER